MKDISKKEDREHSIQFHVLLIFPFLYSFSFISYFYSFVLFVISYSEIHGTNELFSYTQ